MRYPKLRKKVCPFKIKHKKTGKIETVVGFGPGKVNYHTKVFLSDGNHYSLRFLLMKCELICEWKTEKVD